MDYLALFLVIVSSSSSSFYSSSSCVPRSVDGTESGVTAGAFRRGVVVINVV